MVVQKVPNPQEMKSTPTAKQEPKLKKQKYSNKTSQKPTNSDNSNQMEESEVFYGKRFVNIKNDCYINSVVNLILSSEAVREVTKRGIEF